MHETLAEVLARPQIKTRLKRAESPQPAKTYTTLRKSRFPLRVREEHEVLGLSVVIDPFTETQAHHVDQPSRR